VTAVQDTSQALERDGYVVLRDVLAPAEVDEIAAAIDPLLEQTPTGRIDFEGYKTRRVYNLLGKTGAADRLVEHPDVLELVERTLGPHALLSVALVIHIEGDEKAQVLHKDDSLFPVPWPHQPLVVNTMWAISDFTADNGATRLVPGSHVERDLPAGAETIAAEMEQGSVLVWVGSLYHGGGANTTGAARTGIAVNYSAGWLRQQENLILAIPRERVDQMSERLQRLVGYGYHPPFIGFVDGRDPQRLLKRGDL
jgi:ectoine hydroxylase-related dioxygenase (phytanoyl-CoA dioxygenase family)